MWLDCEFIIEFGNLVTKLGTVGTKLRHSSGTVEAVEAKEVGRQLRHIRGTVGAGLWLRLV